MLVTKIFPLLLQLRHLSKILQATAAKEKSANNFCSASVNLCGRCRLSFLPFAQLFCCVSAMQSAATQVFTLAPNNRYYLQVHNRHGNAGGNYEQRSATVDLLQQNGPLV